MICLSINDFEYHISFQKAGGPVMVGWAVARPTATSEPGFRLSPRSATSTDQRKGIY
jgi:hypothetical protein